MSMLDTFLTGVAIVAVGVWSVLVWHVLAVQRRRLGARRLVARAIDLLNQDSIRRAPLKDQIDQLRPLASKASRELIMRAAVDCEPERHAFKALFGYMTDRWGADALVEDAARHSSAREKWRRTTALRLLYGSNHQEIMRLLADAIEDPDPDVGGEALSLLGSSTDPRALDILFEALRSGRHAASRVAAHLERSPQPIAGRLKQGITDPHPDVRLWCAALLSEYPEEGSERDLAGLTGDPDPRVRKAAIQTLGRIGHVVAADCALRLLADPVPYVRAHAARALGELRRPDLAERVAPLLADTDWWARLAARESLEMMGTSVWPVLMRRLSHRDRFVRNGAAEVIQNLGVLDSLIVMEAASDTPDAAKIEMLRRISSAGGARFTDSLVERAGPAVGLRIRRLLATIGLERVEAA